MSAKPFANLPFNVTKATMTPRESFMESCRAWIENNAEPEFLRFVEHDTKDQDPSEIRWDGYAMMWIHSAEK